MPAMWNYLFIMLWVAFMLSAGIHLFSRGFLLSRDTLTEVNECRPLAFCTDPQNASCLDPAMVQRALRDQPDTLADVCLPAKSRVILLVVDALKYDFGLYDPARKHPEPFENKLPFLHELRTTRPAHTRLLRFTADPPTTTLQRLKGLTTGSLPTFIDVGSNFATGEINEDNVIDQLVRSGRKAVFMGDSTWTDLYPRRFARAHPMPSFNIYDLDTVDRNVERLLPIEQANTDWDLLVAHVLGVDHCGHKHGPYHTEMARKLSETDRLIRDIVARMDNTTTLLVVGDHGMTRTGDHGGDSPDETNALLFAYSPVAAFHMDDTVLDATVMQQIDLVPTMAAILGLPIPYSSLGQINYNLLPRTVPAHVKLSEQHEFLVHSLQNGRQLRRYQAAMTARTAGLFDDDQAATHALTYHQLLDGLKARSDNGANRAALLQFHANELRPYALRLQRQFADVWVKFDPSQMSQGLLFVSLFAVLLCMWVNNLPVQCYDRSISSGRCAFILATNIALAAIGWAFPRECGLPSRQQAIIVLTSIGNMCLIGTAVIVDFDTIVGTLRVRSSVQHPLAAVVWLVRVLFTASVAVCFSNSFIVQEQQVLSYALMAVLAVLLWGVQKTNMQFDVRRKVTLQSLLRSTYVRLLALTVATVALVRLSHSMFRCREEHGADCVDGRQQSVTTAEGGLSGRARRVHGGDLVPVVVVAVLVGCARRLVERFGTLRGFRPAVCVARYGSVVLGVMVGVHFVMARALSGSGGGAGILGASISAVHVDALAWAAYAVAGAQIVVLVASPLLVYVHSDVGANSIQGIFRQVRDGWTGGAAGAYDMFVQIPQTDGLTGVYTSVFVMCALCGGAVVALVLGAQAASGVAVVLAVGVAVLVLGSVQRFQASKSIEKCLQPDFSILLAWTLLAHFAFYATAHQPTLSQIDWHAAFVGRQSPAHVDHNNITSVLLVLLNTFGASALVFLLYPLLCLFGFALYANFPALIPKPSVAPHGRFLVNVKQPENGANHVLGRQHTFELLRGELSTYERGETLLANVFRTGMQLMVLQGFRIFAAMLACTIHCRHLMVWKIFAPRFIYEGLMSYAMFAAIVAGYLIVVRIHLAIDRLLRSITLDKTVFDRLEREKRDEELRRAGKRPEQMKASDVNRLLHEKITQHLEEKEKKAKAHGE